MVKNYCGDMPDKSFFAVLRNSFEHDKAVELIEAAYTPAEIEEIGERRSRRFTFKLEFGYLDEAQTNADLIAALREECRVKKDGIFVQRAWCG